MNKFTVFSFFSLLIISLCHAQSDTEQLLIAVCDIVDTELLEKGTVTTEKSNDIEYISCTYDVYLLKCRVHELLYGEYGYDTISIKAFRMPRPDSSVPGATNYRHALLSIIQSAQGYRLLDDYYNYEVFETTDGRWIVSSKGIASLSHVLLSRDSIHSVELKESEYSTYEFKSRIREKDFSSNYRIVGENRYIPLYGVYATAVASARMKSLLHEPNDYSMRDSAFLATLTYEPVDLGLSVNWASCNVGASGPESPGCYYAWGETAEKAFYSEENYKWYDDERKLTKYCTDAGYGCVDNRVVLEASDDAAATLCGRKWRMPTARECNELRKNCTIAFTEFNGAAGFRLTSKLNGNSIFLPCSGMCYNQGRKYDDGIRIWSSTLKTTDSVVKPYYLEILLRSSGIQDNIYSVVSYDSQDIGYSVRPVCDR